MLSPQGPASGGGPKVKERLLATAEIRILNGTPISRTDSSGAVYTNPALLLPQGTRLGLQAVTGDAGLMEDYMASQMVQEPSTAIRTIPGSPGGG